MQRPFAPISRGAFAPASQFGAPYWPVAHLWPNYRAENDSIRLGLEMVKTRANLVMGFRPAFQLNLTAGCRDAEWMNTCARQHTPVQRMLAGGAYRQKTFDWKTLQSHPSGQRKRVLLLLAVRWSHKRSARGGAIHACGRIRGLVHAQAGASQRKVDKMAESPPGDNCSLGAARCWEWPGVGSLIITADNDRFAADVVAVAEKTKGDAN